MCVGGRGRAVLLERYLSATLLRYGAPGAMRPFCNCTAAQGDTLSHFGALYCIIRAAAHAGTSYTYTRGRLRVALGAGCTAATGGTRESASHGRSRNAAGSGSTKRHVCTAVSMYEVREQEQGRSLHETHNIRPSMLERRVCHASVADIRCCAVVAEASLSAL